MRADRRGYRRGRPLERYRIGDPLARRPGFRQAQLQASVALMRNPAGPEIFAAPMKRGLQLLSDPEGRKFFEEWVIPLYPEQLDPALRDLLRIFEHADPTFLANLMDRVEADVVAVSREVFPRLATALETVLKQDESSTATPVAGPPSPEPEQTAGDSGQGVRRERVRAREGAPSSGMQEEPS